MAQQQQQWAEWSGMVGDGESDGWDGNGAGAFVHLLREGERECGVVKKVAAEGLEGGSEWELRIRWLGRTGSPPPPPAAEAEVAGAEGQQMDVLTERHQQWDSEIKRI